MNAVNIFRIRLRQAVKESANAVQDYAAEHHEFHSHTSALEQSVDTAFIHGGMTGRVFLNTRRAPYGPFVHEGTPPHIIRPKNRQALRWVAGADFVFSRNVHHPGYRGDPFLYNALDAMNEEIDRIFDRYITLALEEVANGL